MSLVQNIVYSNPTELLILLFICSSCCYSVTKSCLTPCEPHELQQALLLCPSLSHGVYSNSCPLNQGYHPTILSSVIPFLHLQSFPASGSSQMSQFFLSGGQSTGVSALASFFPKKSQSWSPLEWTGWISLQSKGLSRVFSNATVQKHQFLDTQPSLRSNNHIHMWLLEKP